MIRLFALTVIGLFGAFVVTASGAVWTSGHGDIGKIRMSDYELKYKDTVQNILDSANKQIHILWS